MSAGCEVAALVRLWWARASAPWRSERGANLVETSLLLALIVLVVLVAVTAFGVTAGENWSKLSSSIDNGG